MEAAGLVVLGVWKGGVEGEGDVEALSGRGVLTQGDQCEACTEQAAGLVVLGVWEDGVERVCGVETLDGGGVLTSLERLSGLLKQRRRDGA